MDPSVLLPATAGRAARCAPLVRGFAVASVVALGWAADPLTAQVQLAWRFSLEQGRTIRSTVTVQNRCHARHEFAIGKDERLSFLTFLDPVAAVAAPPGGGSSVGVEFSSIDLAPGLYEGVIEVRCLDCAHEPGCTQDKDLLAVEMTVTAPLATTVQDQPRDCTCELKEPKGPEAVCLGETATVSVRYEGKGKGRVDLEAKVERLERDAAALADDVKPNPTTKNVSCTASTNFEIKPRPGKAGRYKATFSAPCAAKPVDKEFYVVDLGKIDGPARLFLAKNDAKKKAAGEWTVELDPAGAPAASVTWEIVGGKDAKPVPDKGSGTTAKAELPKVGAYTVRFRCGKVTRELKVEVGELAEAAITGPSLLCHQPVGGAGSCAEPARTEPEGTWRLDVKPALADLRWQVDKYLKNALQPIAKGPGASAKAALTDPACYRVSFWSGEGLVASREVLGVWMDLDVVVDGDLSTDAARPVEVPIYAEEFQEVCFRMALTACRRFPLRFRLETRPAIPLAFTPTDLALAPDTDQADTDNAFTGWHGGPTVCEPGSRRTDFFTLVGEKSGRLEVTATNPRSGEEHKVARIDLTVPEAIQDVRVVDDRDKVVKALVERDRVPVGVFWVEDGAGHRSELFDLSAAERGARIDQLFAVANTYWSQCGICFAPVPKRGFQVAGDLGAQVDTSDEKNRIVAVNDSLEGSPGVWLDFVHAVAPTAAETVSATGPGRPDFVVFFSNPGKDGRGAVLGHEFLHGIADLDRAHTGQGACDLGRETLASYADGRIAAGQCAKARTAVTARLAILTGSPLPDASRRVEYKPVVFRAVGGAPPLTWSAAKSGAQLGLPVGMALAADGTLAGTPTSTAASYEFTVKVVDKDGRSAERGFQIQVEP